MYKSANILLLVSAVFLVLSCEENKTDNTEKQSGKPLFNLLFSDVTNITFNNIIEENESFNMVDFFYVYNGGGVAIGDVNNDGLSDIYFTGNLVDDKLFLNKGDFKFEDISDKAGINIPGWSTGVTMVDINHDGLLDIYVCRSGNFDPDKRKNVLFINQGNLKFNEQAEIYGLADTSYSTQAAFLDYDKDGDLDMYLLNHTNEIRDPNNVRPLVDDGSGLANDRLYRNNEVENSKITFTDVTKEAGILYDGLGLGVGIDDINSDGWEDIFVTNDFIANDYLYINNKDGTFSEMSKSYFDHVSHFSMGNDLADFNNDGLVDIITMDMRPRDNYHEKKMSGPLNFDLFERTLQQGYMPQYMRNTLQLNNGFLDAENLSFSEIGQLSGIDATDWSWAPLLADFDNDGLKDLFVSNGYLRDITDLDFINYTGSLSRSLSNDSLDVVLKQKAKAMPAIKLSNFIFKNKGNLDFENITEPWGLNQPSLSNGAAYADLDNDGDLDMIVNNINDIAFIYENKSEETTKNGFLRVNLVGDSLNPTALGAKVTLFHEGSLQYANLAVTRGYQSSVDHLIHFGLGEKQTIDSLIVQWPDGKTTKSIKPKSNQLLSIVKDQTARAISKQNTNSQKNLFRDVSTELALDYLHRDEVYYDFNHQFLLPHKHSNQGPGLAVADVDGDGNDDMFMGGGYNHSGRLFYGTDSNQFNTKKLTTNEKEKYEEDTGALFFDYDGDGDQDLYIVSGSNEFYDGSEYYQDRLYNNDGKGNFKLDVGALPIIRTSGSCVRAADFDQDGDLDLFVGGRLTPLQYPLPPKSYLLVNTNGKFIDATDQLAPSLRKTGMVTDALWTDYDNDLDTDLIVVGEFMSIQFYENDAGKLTNQSSKTGMTHTSGWWNSINGGDFDNDGDVDYVLGNLGLNSKYKVTAAQPLTIYALDYDKNGSIDPIISFFRNGKEYPVHSRDDLIKQIPQMKKKFPDYTSYAQATLSDVLTKQEQGRAYIVKAFQFASAYLQNNGDGRFELKSLPHKAQVAPVYGILIEDFDDDGNLDVLLAGNNLGTEVGIGRYDASKGILLKGAGNGNFTPVSGIDTGILLNGDIRSAATIKNKDRLVYVFGRNSDTLKTYMVDSIRKESSLMNVPPNISKAKITYQDGTEHVREFYYGASYLSQSSRYLLLNGDEKQITMYNFSGKPTIIK